MGAARGRRVVVPEQAWNAREMKLPTYDFKILPEIGWSIFVGVLVAVGTELATFNAHTLDDPRVLIASLIGGMARAVGAAILSVLRPTSS